ncbi:hypothetical protein Tco_1027869, partial [Tanacetum coccineum]
MLSLGTMHEVSLIFKFPEQPNVDLKSVKLITVKWRKEELNICSTDMVELASNNWSSVKMWRFINHGPNAEFDVVIDGFSYPEFPNISFNEDIEGFKSLSISDEKDVDNDDDDEYWENKLRDEGSLCFAGGSSSLVSSSRSMVSSSKSMVSSSMP